MNGIGDYALLGDCHSISLVGRDGSIDWASFPRFDSPSVFCRVLDEHRGGSFSMTPAAPRSVHRSYLRGTNVLVTSFECEGGAVEVTDCMPVLPLAPRDPTKVRSLHAILRRVRCTAGSVDVSMVVAPRFEYGLFVPRFALTSAKTARVVGGADALRVSATRDLRCQDDRIQGEWGLRRGEETWVQVSWSPSHDVPKEPPPLAAAMARRLDDTIAFWRAWLARCWYDGDHEAEVHRSALCLKALTHAPTGSIVAAPTTSLPEQLGGERNWDYRYTWIRDATLTLTALLILGYREEADDFKAWLQRTTAGRPQDLQIMYGICGERSLPEFEVTHLAGHRGSAPVRVGNGAVKQLQLDSFGQIIEAAYLYGRSGGVVTPTNWAFLSGLADIVCRRWREPDQGIWEMRDEPRHFVHSKLNCWVALDRAVTMAAAAGLPGPVARWAGERDALRSYLLDQAGAPGWFPQATGSDTADASVLLVPALGLLPTNHPAVMKTVEVVRRELEEGGLLHRYQSSDGLEGGEGTFLLCSFWMLDCLTHAGRIDEADALLERLLGLANDVGLYAEEADPATGEALGNFPQAFTHMALVTSCAHLSAARRGQLPTGDEPHDYAELALDRLLARLP